MHELDGAYLLVTSSPYLLFGLIILAAGSKGFQSRFPALIDDTPALIASVFVGLVGCKEERVFRVRWKIRPSAGGSRNMLLRCLLRWKGIE